MMDEPEITSTPEKQPVSFGEAIRDRRNLVLIALAGLGLILFGVLFANSFSDSGQQLLPAIKDLGRGFSQLDQAGIDTLEHRQVFGDQEILAPGYQLLWAIFLGLGIWGWMLVERSFRNADPTIEISLRRSAIFGLGFVLYVVIGFDLTHPSSFTAGGTLPIPGFDAAWNSPAPNLLLESLTPLLIVSVIAGYAVVGVRTRFLLTLSAVLVLILYPVFASWLWDDGWLAQMKRTSPRSFPTDMAGAGVIHLLCGVIGIAVLAGCRWSAHEPLPREKMRPERAFSAILGLILIQFAFIALIGNSVREASGIRIAEALLQGTVAATAGGLVTGIARIRIQIRPLSHTLLFGTMGGWVIVSGGVGGFEIWQCAVLGVIAGVVVMTGLALLDTMELRDPFALVPIHFGCGAIGFMAACWSRWEPPNLILQLVGMIAIIVPALLISTVLVWIFVRKNRLSKRDPEMPVVEPINSAISD
ncbi:MAG: Amt family ammonium transporter [Verrucomicrobiales bacterium]|jgi:Amt family ammonium transporter